MCTLMSTVPKAQSTISSVLTEKGKGGSGRGAEGLWGRYPQSFLSAVLLPPPGATPVDKLFCLSFYTFACSLLPGVSPAGLCALRTSSALAPRAFAPSNFKLQPESLSHSLGLHPGMVSSLQ